MPLGYVRINDIKKHFVLIEILTTIQKHWSFVWYGVSAKVKGFLKNASPRNNKNISN